MDLSIKFSMDRIKNMDQLYTWTPTYSEELGCPGEEEHYHGTDYCKQVIADVFATMNWGTQKYLGSLDRIANEVFNVNSTEGINYRIEFAINTYEKKAARLECTITGLETENYDQRLEELKIALKNRLAPDWEVCTWLVDMQSAQLCKEAYEKAFIIENNLRAFASKVLIHFLGADWLSKPGLEKQSESVKNLKEKFTQRVPEFDNINTDFLSMTLETLFGVLFDSVTYNTEFVLNRDKYNKLFNMASKNVSGQNIADYIKSKRTVEKNIWDDLFVPFIGEPEKFKDVAHKFIEDRNHVAHSKILSWNSYQVILNDFEKMNEQDEIGVARGLAWTSVGGDTLSIEVNVMPGSGKVELTGKLGDVMKESAMAAISYIRANSQKLGIAENFHKTKDIHIHVPEGAVPKDGPSAGITMATAVVSALTKNPVRNDIAMTGEITLRGRVLPIGGLKEKSLAAFRAGITDIIIPNENKADIDDVPKEVRSKINFIPVKSMDTVLENALR